MIAAWPSAGVEPLIPVAAGSLPNARAASKSTPTTWEFGTVRRSDLAPPSSRRRKSRATGRRRPRSSAGRSAVASANATPPASRAVTSSSTGPRCCQATCRIDESIVSPTTADPVMIAAPSSDPSTTRRASRGRRTALRSASRRRIGRRSRTKRNGRATTTETAADGHRTTVSCRACTSSPVFPRRSSATSRPSRTVIRRSAWAATVGVVRYEDDGEPLFVELAEQVDDGRAISESRLPVGSSAQTMRGLPASARATATRCCSPPESSIGVAGRGGGRARPG